MNKLFAIIELQKVENEKTYICQEKKWQQIKKPNVAAKQWKGSLTGVVKGIIPHEQNMWRNNQRIVKRLRKDGQLKHTPLDKRKVKWRVRQFTV